MSRVYFAFSKGVLIIVLYVTVSGSKTEKESTPYAKISYCRSTAHRQNRQFCSS